MYYNTIHIMSKTTAVAMYLKGLHCLRTKVFLKVQHANYLQIIIIINNVW